MSRGVYRCLRGGSWSAWGDWCLSGLRSSAHLDDGHRIDYGFRIVLASESEGTGRENDGQTEDTGDARRVLGSLRR